MCTTPPTTSTDAHAPPAPGASGRGRLTGLLILLAIVPAVAAAQDPESPVTVASAAADTLPAVVPLSALNVTVTGGARQVFDTPAPVLVVERTALDRRASGRPMDLLATQPGLDGVGVGPVRHSPVIRGLQGQRILLLEDGIRLNNPRREVARGEPVALADLGYLERIEVVRGPASVLYGSDAIGGVINFITDPFQESSGRRIGGRIEAAAGTSGSAGGAAVLRAGGPGLRASLAMSVDDHAEYRAPAGRFGEIELLSATPVHDSGGQERRWSGAVAHSLASGKVFLRHHQYRAEDTGFGYVEPSLLGDDGTRVRIHIPEQQFTRTSAGYRGAELGRWWGDRAEVVVFRQGNDRVLVTDVLAPLPSPAPSDATLASVSRNTTDLTTRGSRLEVRKLMADRALLTYGVDVARDRSRNRDTTTTTISGLGPPQVTGRGTSPVPSTRLTSMGLFAQAELPLANAVEATGGLRWQRTEARTTDDGAAGEGGSSAERHSDDAVVGALSLLLRTSSRTSVVASVARGFRSPNLVERFYSGPSPDGRGVWIRNPELAPEWSRSLDLGFRYRSGGGHLEVFLFDNLIRDGIRLSPTGREVDGRREYRNENLEELRIRGVELASGLRLSRGVVLGLGHTRVRGRNPTDPAVTVVDTDGDRTVATVRLEAQRRWLDYSVRHVRGQGGLEPGLSPVGDRMPGFTVQDLRAGYTVREGHRVVAEVTNLTDRLYAESANTSFFRPAPRRALRVRWIADF
jgi:hemoglobin/transferrin/lactoferrin receptor protein